MVLTLVALAGVGGTGAMKIVKNTLGLLGVGGKPRLQQLVAYAQPQGGAKLWSVTLRYPAGDFEGYVDDASGKVGTIQLAGSGRGPSPLRPGAKQLGQAVLEKKAWSVVNHFRGKQTLRFENAHFGGGTWSAAFPIKVNGLDFLDSNMMYWVSLDSTSGAFVSYRAAPGIPPVPPASPKITLAQAEKLIEKYKPAMPVSKRRFHPGATRAALPHYGLELGYMFDDSKKVHLVWRGYYPYPDPLDSTKSLMGERIVIDAHDGTFLKRSTY